MTLRKKVKKIRVNCLFRTVMGSSLALSRRVKIDKVVYSTLSSLTLPSSRAVVFKVVGARGATSY